MRVGGSCMDFAAVRLAELVFSSNSGCASGRAIPGWRGSGPRPRGGVLVETFLESKGGWLVAGTAASGLFCLPVGSSAQFLHFCRTNLFSTDWIIATCEDREGGLWIGTSGAGLQLRPRRVHTAMPPDQWQGRAVLTVCASGDDSLWVGSEDHGLYHYNYVRDAWQNFSDGQTVHPYVWSVAEDTQRKSGRGPGVEACSNCTTARSSPFRLWRALRHPFPPFFPRVVAAFGWGPPPGLLHYQDGRTNWLRSDLSQVLRNVRAIVEERNGNVWFGTGGYGLGCLQPDGKVRRLSKHDGLASDFVQCLHSDTDGTLWIGSSGAGLCRYKEGSFSTIGRAQGLPHENICTILDDGLGFLWLSSRGGIIRVARAELNSCADGHSGAVSSWSTALAMACPLSLVPRASGRLQDL